MNTTILLSLAAFCSTLVFAAVIAGWRQRLLEEALAKRPSSVAEGDEPMVTLVVPARNAADTLTPLLQDLYAQTYPKEKLEVLVVDDASEDDTVGIVRGFMRTWPQLRVLASDAAGKKAAITRGVREARGELVIITDADARCGAGRVRWISAKWNATNADMVLLPVCTRSIGGFLGRLQEDEQAALVGVSAGSALGGSPMLANGANMAFKKEAFDEVGGFQGDRFASGDDIFLLERMKRAGKRISYAMDPDALVTVQACVDVKSFFQQRLRWAGKMRGVGGPGKWAGALGLLLPFGLLYLTCSFSLHETAGQGLFRSLLLLGCAWLFWALPVLALVKASKAFLGLSFNPFTTLFSFVLFSLYAPLFAVLAFFLRPNWKGRRI